MTRNAAVYGTCGAILVACLAAANMPSQDADVPPPRASRSTHIVPDAIAADVQAQAARLREQMSDAPTPAAHVRNPFAFASAAPRASQPMPRPSIVEAAVAADTAPAPPPAPSLLLMGIAEDATPAGPRRTAIIALRQAAGDPDQSRGGGEGDPLFIVVEGESVAGRYKVTRIGADAVELEDLTTKAYRRIALR